MASLAFLRRRLPHRSWCISSQHYLRGRTASPADNKPLFLAGNVFDVTEDEIMKHELIQKTAFWRTKARMDSLTSLHTRAALEEELFFPSSAPPDAAANLRDYVVGLGSFQKNQRHLWTLGGRPRVSYTRANNPF